MKKGVSSNVLFGFGYEAETKREAGNPASQFLYRIILNALNLPTGTRKRNTL